MSNWKAHPNNTHQFVWSDRWWSLVSIQQYYKSSEAIEKYINCTEWERGRISGIGKKIAVDQAHHRSIDREEYSNFFVASEDQFMGNITILWKNKRVLVLHRSISGYSTSSVAVVWMMKIMSDRSGLLLLFVVVVLWCRRCCSRGL